MAHPKRPANITDWYCYRHADFHLHVCPQKRVDGSTGMECKLQGGGVSALFTHFLNMWNNVGHAVGTQ